MISVIVPVYNSEKYLRKCLDSIVSQTFIDYEVICVNDGSKDSSLEILKEYCEKDGRFRVVSIDNHGQAYGRNLGIQLAKGDTLCFIDSDDIVSCDYLEKMMHCMQETKSDVVFCDMERVFESGGILEKKFSYYDSFAPDIKGQHVLEDKEIIFKTIQAPYCKLIQTELLRKNGICFMEGKIYEDLFFTQMLLAVNPKISVVPEKMYFYYVHPGSTMTRKDNKLDDIYDIFDSVIDVYTRNSLYDLCFKELEYLCLHHVAIGAVYRRFKSNPAYLMKEIKKVRKYLKRHGFTIHNCYVQKKNALLRIYFTLLYSLL